ncbi:MAG TPA: SH3 domain-containing protein [Xanthomonadaceae bacterium]|jgi:uncharacterized protein YraI|nr:SH3 domain-containing protein [Xanthomonadaceae bacterium]
MKRILLTSALGLSFFASAAAFAASGYVVGDVSLQAGPDDSYPSVGMLSAGTPVAIEGCVEGWSWCDVGTPDGRGWVAGSYLQEDYQGQRVLIPEYGARIGISFVVFNFGTYWDSNYRNRSWYGERVRYSQIRPRFRSVAVNVNVGSHSPRDAGRDQHGRGRVAPTPVVQHGPPNNGVQPRRPVAVARSGARDTAHGRPTQAKAPAPRGAEQKAQPKPHPEHSDGKASESAQH